MSIEGQGHFFTIYFPGFVCFLLYYAKISDERLHDHWSSGLDTVEKISLKRYQIHYVKRTDLDKLCCYLFVIKQLTNKHFFRSTGHSGKWYIHTCI